MLIQRNVRKRKLRATVAANRGTSHVSRSGWAEAPSNTGVLNGVLMHDERTLRKQERDQRDTNANRKNGGWSTYYRQHEGWGY